MALQPSVLNITLKVLQWYHGSFVSLVCEVGKQIVQCAELLWKSGYSKGGAVASVVIKAQCCRCSPV